MSNDIISWPIFQISKKNCHRSTYDDVGPLRQRLRERNCQFECLIRRSFLQRWSLKQREELGGKLVGHICSDAITSTVNFSRLIPYQLAHRQQSVCMPRRATRTPPPIHTRTDQPGPRPPRSSFSLSFPCV